MFRLAFVLAAPAFLLGCATVDRVPSTALSTTSASDIAFDRDLYRLEAGTVFDVSDVQVDIYDSAWQTEWQGYVFDADTLSVDEAERLDDEFYDLPIWRTNEDVVDDVAIKDRLGDIFGEDVQLLYRAPKSEFESEADALEAYVESANAFYSELETQNELVVNSNDRRMVDETNIAQSVKLSDNYLNLSGYDKGEEITNTETDTDFYLSGLLFDPKMSILDAALANVRKSHEQFIDAAVLAYLAVNDENLFLVVGQSSTIRMPPGVVDSSGTFNIAHSYKDGTDLSLPVELFLYRSRQLVSDLIK